MHEPWNLILLHRERQNFQFPRVCIAAKHSSLTLRSLQGWIRVARFQGVVLLLADDPTSLRIAFMLRSVDAP